MNRETKMRWVVLVQVLIVCAFLAVFSIGSRFVDLHQSDSNARATASRFAFEDSSQQPPDAYFEADMAAILSELNKQCKVDMTQAVVATKSRIEQAGFHITNNSTARGMLALIIHAKTPCADAGSSLFEHISVKRFA